MTTPEEQRTQRQGAPDDAALRRVLRETRTIAAVGLSPNELRPSFFVGRYLKLKGFRVIAVNPAHAGKTLFGETVVADLADIPEEVGPVHMLDVFRRSEEAGAVVDRALEVLLPRGLRAVWLQIGVIDDAAMGRARAAGLDAVQDRCPKIEYQRLFGELRWGGFNTGVISSKM